MTFFAGKKREELKSAKLGIGRKLLEWKRSGGEGGSKSSESEEKVAKWFADWDLSVLLSPKENCFPSQPEIRHRTGRDLYQVTFLKGKPM